MRDTMKDARVSIVWMGRSDLESVLQIEQLGFGTAWNEDDFLRFLRQRNCIGMVANHGEKVVGFMIYELLKSKLHVAKFAVHPAWRRLGVGRQMVAKLRSKLHSHRRNRIVLDIPERNLVAQKFFRSQGFEATQTLQDYDDDGDAYRMVLRIQE